MEIKLNGHRDYQEYRNGTTAQGLDFQDWIMERLEETSLFLNMYSSQVGQRKGENRLGMEIKNNTKYHPVPRGYGTLNIEYGEKAEPRSGPYAPSGINRNDNSWLFGIGDKESFWIFAITTLKDLWVRREQLGINEYVTPTSKGYKLPLDLADKYCARKLIFKGDKVSQILTGNLKCEFDLDGLSEQEIRSIHEG